MRVAQRAEFQGVLRIARRTHGEIAAPALVANEVAATMPSDADAVAQFSVGDMIAENIDAAGDFMPRYARILQLLATDHL